MKATPFLILILLIGIAATAAYFSMNKNVPIDVELPAKDLKSKFSTPEVIERPDSFIKSDPEPLSDVENRELFYIAKDWISPSNKKKYDVVIAFPQGTEIYQDQTQGSEHTEEYIKLNGNTYYIEYFNPIPRPGCSWGDETCGYDDVVLKESPNESPNPIVRVWKNDNNIFMLNPQTLTIGGYYQESMLITKRNPGRATFDALFSQAEVDNWITILRDNVGLIEAQ